MPPPGYAQGIPATPRPSWAFDLLSVLDLLDSAVLLLDSEWCCLACTRAARQLFSAMAPAINGQPLFPDLLPESARASLQSAAARAASQPQGTAAVVTAVDGQLLELNLAAAGSCWLLGAPVLPRSSVDALTGLPDRQALQQALQGAEQVGLAMVLIYVSLDHFRSLNTVYGYQVGDQVLREVGTRLRRTVCPIGGVARVSGDEFVALVSVPPLGSDGAARLAQEALALACAPMPPVDGIPLHVDASVGWAYVEPPLPAAEAMRRADLAVHQAKEAGGRQVRQYVSGMASELAQRWQALRELRHAVLTGTLHFHYQPVVDLRSGLLCGAEALARWPRPDGQMWMPDRFIPLAETTDLIIDIDALALRAACEQFVRWLPLFLLPPRLQVNASVRFLTSPRALEAVQSCLERFNLPPRSIELEVTERALVSELPRLQSSLEQLRQLGVAIAIDDFGTGYSNLASLKSLPLDTLKLDRSLTLGLPNSAESQAIAQAALHIGHALHLTVLAEGLESDSQWNWLSEAGFDLVQGYRMSRPIPPEHMPDTLKYWVVSARQRILTGG